MESTLITKELAEFIVKTATKVVGTKSHEKTFFIPNWFKLTEVMIDCNGISGKFNGEWKEYDLNLTEEAEEILGIY